MKIEELGSNKVLKSERHNNSLELVVQERLNSFVKELRCNEDNEKV